MKITIQTKKIAGISTAVLFDKGCQVATDGVILAVYTPAQSEIDGFAGLVPSKVFEGLKFAKDTVTTLVKSNGLAEVEVLPDNLKHTGELKQMKDFPPYEKVLPPKSQKCIKVKVDINDLIYLLRVMKLKKEVTLSFYGDVLKLDTHDEESGDRIEGIIMPIKELSKKNESIE